MSTKQKQNGFTLIELITVIIILGIIAITVIPRFANKSNFEARGYYDATLAMLQYAQKSAVAQRRRVCVVRVVPYGGSPDMRPYPQPRIASTFAATTCLEANNLLGPDGTTPYTLVAPIDITLNATPAFVGFDFLPSGAPVRVGTTTPLAQQTFTVSGMSGKTITIDGVTGYVYSN